MPELTSKPANENNEKSSEIMLRSLCNGINDIILVLAFTDTGEVGPIVEINDVACSRLGYSREELLNMTTEPIILPEYLELQNDVHRLLAGEGKAIYESAYRSKDGRIIPGALDLQVQHSSERMVAWENTTHI
jgi:PAS domain S-box-containing protein